MALLLFLSYKCSFSVLQKMRNRARSLIFMSVDAGFYTESRPASSTNWLPVA